MQHFLLLMSMLLALPAWAGEWPRFRGPNGSGVAPALEVPNEWSEDDYAWRVNLPGVGHSSPVVHHDLVYITSGNAEAGEVHLDAYYLETGERQWRGTLPAGGYSMHASNAVASSTPAVDDHHVYLSYCSDEGAHLVAFSHAGEEVWRTNLGEYAAQHGFGSSPMVVGDVLCLEGDNTQGGYLVGLETSNGDERWRVERPAGKETYSTPAVLSLPSGKQALVVTSMTAGLRAIDPETGNELWQRSDAMPARTVSSPITAGDLVLAACGGGGTGKQLVAVRLSDAGQPDEAYTLTKNVPYVPTAVASDDLLFLWHDRGTVACVELATGEQLWNKRVGGKFFGSPILIGDRLLAVSMDGEAVMLAAGPEFEVLGRTDLGEGTEATPAVADGHLLVRTESKLWCLKP